MIPEKDHEWTWLMLSPHNGEYWYECKKCGESDWVSHDADPTGMGAGECKGKKK